MTTKNGSVLRIAPSGGDRVSEALENGHLIIGWSAAKGLLDEELEWEGFREIIREVYSPDAEKLRKAGSAGGHMWRFIRDMKIGDLVVVPHGSEFYVGEVAGPAFYDENKVDEDSAYRRPVKWLNGKRPIPRAVAKSALLSRMKTRGTSADAKASWKKSKKSKTGGRERRVVPNRPLRRTFKAGWSRERSTSYDTGVWKISVLND